MFLVATQAAVQEIVRSNIARESRLHTDESKLYFRLALSISHRMKVLKHSADEYVRGDVTTNTVEGYFSIFTSSCRRGSRHFCLAGPRIVTIDQLAVDTIEASVGVGVDGTPSA